MTLSCITLPTPSKSERGISVQGSERKGNIPKGDPQTSDQILCSPGDPLIECNHKCNRLTLTTKWVVFPTARRSKFTLCEISHSAVVKARCLRAPLKVGSRSAIGGQSTGAITNATAPIGCLVAPPLRPSACLVAPPFLRPSACLVARLAPSFAQCLTIG